MITKVIDKFAPFNFPLAGPNKSKEARISYDLPEDSFVSVSVYDMRGTLIKTLVNDVQSSGYKTLQWNGTNDKGQKVSAGLYLYRIEAEGFTDAKKMALLK